MVKWVWKSSSKHTWWWIHTLAQHNKDRCEHSMSGEKWWVTISDLSTALELPTETVHKSVHEELGHHNLRVHAGYQDVWWKSTYINIFILLLHTLSGFKKEISSWNPQWQATRQHLFTQHTKQVGTKWKHLTSQTAKTFSASVCLKSSDIYILECRSHPCWIHALGHNMNAYCYTLCRMSKAICRMRPRHLFGVWSFSTRQTHSTQVRNQQWMILITTDFLTET